MRSIAIIAVAATTVTVLCGCDEILKPDSSAGSGANDGNVDDSTDEATEPAAWPKEHTIKPDDTLFSIARKYYDDGSEWEWIANANPGVDATGLMVGHEITIPAPR